MAERTIFAVDYYLSCALVCAWEATLRRQQQAAEEDFGRCDIWLPAASATDDHRPLD
jgi:hypothetical protein